MIGGDFGYAQDPNAFLRTFMSDDESTIYIDYEAHGIRTEIDDLPDLIDEIPRFSRDWPIVADSARPETISYLARRNFAIAGAKKGPGSVEDGITFLQGKTIIIHPRCKHTLGEFKTHKFKRHAKTNAISAGDRGREQSLHRCDQVCLRRKVDEGGDDVGGGVTVAAEGGLSADAGVV